MRGRNQRGSSGVKRKDCAGRIATDSGSLYLLDGVVRFNILARHEERWTMKRRGITVRTTYRPELVDPIEQSCIEHVILEVDDHGKKVISSIPASS